MNQTRFALGTFDAGTGPFPGLVVGEVVFDTRDVLPHATTAALLADWDAALPVLAATADAPAGEGRPVSALRVLPPVTPPGQIFGAGANYREHVVQMAVAHKLGRSGASRGGVGGRGGTRDRRAPGPGEPYVWAGVPSAVSGAYDDVVLPAVGSDHDWELELGVVIGRRTSNVSVADALDSVAGYTICNDLTTRSLVPRTDIPMMGTDWLRAKNFPTFYPTGPVAGAGPVRGRPARPRHPADPQRHDDAEEQHRGHDLRPGAAHLLHLPAHGAAAGRHGHHRLPARERLPLGPLPPARRRPGVRDRRPGRAAHALRPGHPLNRKDSGHDAPARRRHRAVGVRLEPRHRRAARRLRGGRRRARYPARVIARGGGNWLRTLSGVPGDSGLMGAKTIAGAMSVREVSYLISLFDQGSAELVALLDGNSITGYRTAATSALAADLLAPPGPLDGLGPRLGLRGARSTSGHSRRCAS